MQTASRRHVLVMGEIDGNSPKQHKSPATRRIANMVDDIKGSKPKDRNSIPINKKEELEESVYNPFPKNGRRMPVPLPRPKKVHSIEAPPSELRQSKNRNSVSNLETYQPPKTEMHSIMKPDFNTMDKAAEERQISWPSK